MSCAAGQIECEGTCINPENDRNYCGAVDDRADANAGVSCGAGEVCAGGSCEVSCQAGFVDCGGTCIDPETSRNYCGATGDCQNANAGEACDAQDLCSSGACIPATCMVLSAESGPAGTTLTLSPAEELEAPNYGYLHSSVHET